MSNTYVIYPMLMGRFRAHEKSVFTYRRNYGIGVNSPLLTYLVQGDGKNILFDCGPAGPDKAAEKSHPRLDEHVSLPEALGKRGLLPEQIDCVVLSHLHWDHSYNLEYFPNIPIYVQARELAYAIAPMTCDFTTYNIKQKNGVPQWFSGYENMQIIDGDHTLTDGLVILSMPGHSPGLQCLLVTTKKGNCLLASDHFPLLENYEQNIPSGIHTSLEEWYASSRRIRCLADYVLPGHDDFTLNHESY
ncbi:MBL fold metallo-hydrolase [Betaproteobacteria bacterium]|nr:MBL fold metallo-hydrolase [Betaproteobacteria bacterium]